MTENNFVIVTQMVIKDLIKIRHSYNIADYDKIKVRLLAIPWSDLFTNKGMKEMWSIFTDKLQVK